MTTRIYLHAYEKVLSSKAGATFHQESPNVTFAVHKEHIEIVYKIKAGVYMIINFSRVDSENAVLFADWGNYWKRLSNEKAQIPKIKKCCPTLYKALVGEDEDGVSELYFGATEADKHHGLGIDVKVPSSLPLILCLNATVLNTASALRKKTLTIYNELINNPPFPAWKYGLDDIWE